MALKTIGVNAMVYSSGKFMTSGKGPKVKRGGHYCEDDSEIRKGFSTQRPTVQYHQNTLPCNVREDRYEYGAILGTCIEYEDGTFWISCGEYGSPVNVCPFCGTAAPVQAWKRHE